MGNRVESLAEVQVDNIHCSPLIHPANHAITEIYQIGQAWFVLGESILTSPDNLLFLHLLNDDLQNELFHHLSRDGGKADSPVVPWVLLLALFEDWTKKWTKAQWKVKTLLTKREFWDFCFDIEENENNLIYFLKSCMSVAHNDKKHKIVNRIL